MGRNYKKIAENVHAPSSDDALVYNDGRQIYCDNQRDRNALYPAYICLRCATEYGRMDIPNDVLKAYERQCEQFSKNEHHISDESISSTTGTTVSGNMSYDFGNAVGHISTTSVIDSCSESLSNSETEVGSISTTESTLDTGAY